MCVIEWGMSGSMTLSQERRLLLPHYSGDIYDGSAVRACIRPKLMRQCLTGGATVGGLRGREGERPPSCLSREYDRAFRTDIRRRVRVVVKRCTKRARGCESASVARDQSAAAVFHRAFVVPRHAVVVTAILALQACKYNSADGKMIVLYSNRAPLSIAVKASEFISYHKHGSSERSEA